MEKKIKRYPETAIVGLCTASSTIFSLNIAFAAAWSYAGEQSKFGWTRIDCALAIVAFAAICCLASTPWRAASAHETEPAQFGVRRARASFAWGAALTIMWITIAIAEDIFTSASR